MFITSSVTFMNDFLDGEGYIGSFIGRSVEWFPGTIICWYWCDEHLTGTTGASLRATLE
jgi:hypothetical protein